MERTISILGTGWLGMPLTTHFKKQNYLVKASTTATHKLEVLKNSGIEPYLLEIESFHEDKTTAFFDSEILIINITSKSISGYKNLIKSINASEKIKKVIFVSSTSVYPSSNKVFTEKDKERVNPETNPLVTIEALFMENANFEWVILRFAGLIGYDRKPGNFFKPEKMIKDPQAPVNLIHRDDCIGIIQRVISKEVRNQDFICCAGSHPTKREFYTKATKFLGKPSPLFDENPGAPYKTFENRKVKEVLQYRFKYDDLMNYFEKEALEENKG